MSEKIDIFFQNKSKWNKELKLLRDLLLDSGLQETIKWNQPCYTFNNKNIAILGSYKAHCSLAFFKGVLLQDLQKILIAPGKNSQSVRLVPIKNVQELVQKRDTIKTYILEAISIEEEGLKVKKIATIGIDYIPELKAALDKDKNLANAFFKLTAGRQRAYNIFFESAKQSATRIVRIQKYTDRILDGYGINDCTCGMSKRMPNCDGSHKFI